jgi:hypothetical protein
MHTRRKVERTTWLINGFLDLVRPTCTRRAADTDFDPDCATHRSTPRIITTAVTPVWSQPLGGTGQPPYQLSTLQQPFLPDTVLLKTRFLALLASEVSTFHSLYIMQYVWLCSV